MGGQLAGAELRGALDRLSERRPVFHSEADFQHALAWQIQTEHPGAAVRLETRPFFDRRVYLDVAVNVSGHRIAIELKHLTRGLAVEHEDEAFNLANQSAHDIARYDVIKDIRGVEELMMAGLADSSFVIVLTNDGSYWRPGSGRATADSNFRFHEGCTLTGTLDWGPSAGPGTRKGREQPLVLSGRYEARWSDYSTVEGSAGRFRYLLIAADPSVETSEEQPAETVTAPRESVPRAAREQRGSAEPTARQQVLDAMTSLERRGGRDSFSPVEIIDEVRRRGGTLAESTIRTHITSVMCVDAPAHHGTRHPDLRRVGPGLYQRVR